MHIQIVWNIEQRKQAIFSDQSNPIQDGRGQKAPPPTSFFSVTFTNIGISPKNFLMFSFHPLPHWRKISSWYLVSVPNYWTWTKTTPQKMRFFWSNPNKIEVMITFLVEMLVTKLWSHDHIHNIICVRW